MVADTVERDGRFGEAEALRVIVRNHCIRVLWMQGQLAASTSTSAMMKSERIWLPECAPDHRTWTTWWLILRLALAGALLLSACVIAVARLFRLIDW